MSPAHTGHVSGPPAGSPSAALPALIVEEPQTAQRSSAKELRIGSVVRTFPRPSRYTDANPLTVYTHPSLTTSAPGANNETAWSSGRSLISSSVSRLSIPVRYSVRTRVGKPNIGSTPPALASRSLSAGCVKTGEPTTPPSISWTRPSRAHSTISSTMLASMPVCAARRRTTSSTSGARLSHASMMERMGGASSCPLSFHSSARPKAPWTLSRSS